LPSATDSFGRSGVSICALDLKTQARTQLAQAKRKFGFHLRMPRRANPMHKHRLPVAQFLPRRRSRSSIRPAPLMFIFRKRSSRAAFHRLVFSAERVYKERFGERV
jgi:hypothetical protein